MNQTELMRACCCHLIPSTPSRPPRARSRSFLRFIGVKPSAAAGPFVLDGWILESRPTPETGGQETPETGSQASNMFVWFGFNL